MGYILLVEDNQSNADMMIRLLQTVGLTVKHFIRGLDGSRQAYQERPDLILLDLNLPDVDGRTLILTLKKQLGGPAAPPIIAVTARTGSLEETLAERFGCSAYVKKPFDPQEFLNVVMRFIKVEQLPQNDTL
jgi:DNA-binding response OmpR family regulator